MYFVQSVEEAENKIKETKKKYHDARHNCSCYRVIEEGKIVEKQNDDGEPSGTAGGPMLNILQKKDLVNVVVIVTRYFGGILLRAIILGVEYKVKVDYSNLEKLKYYARTNNINIINTEFQNEILCTIQISNENESKFLEDVEKQKLIIIEYKKICEKYILK